MPRIDPEELKRKFHPVEAFKEGFSDAGRRLMNAIRPLPKKAKKKLERGTVLPLIDPKDPRVKNPWK